MNVQVVRGCIEKWCKTIEGVSKCHSEVIMKQWFAAIHLPVGGRNEDLEKLYPNGLFGDQERESRKRALNPEGIKPFRRKVHLYNDLR